MCVVAQATPRTAGCRELLRARKGLKRLVACRCCIDNDHVGRSGHVLVCVDYSFIELCTLASVCERRYKRSNVPLSSINLARHLFRDVL